MDPSKKSKAKSAAKRTALRKIARTIPFLGALVGIFFVARKIREKGWKRGTADAALDATPVVGRAKAVYELVGDDVIPPPKPA